MTYNFLILIAIFFSLGCDFDNNHKKTKSKLPLTINDEQIKIVCSVKCTDSICIGEYIGPEFLGDIDTAHRLSNLVADSVGRKLKQLYNKKKFSKVDFKRVEMSTEGMGDGIDGVRYFVKIPFLKVNFPCQATTSFDHSGGWGHKPALEKRKIDLLNPEKGIVLCNKLDISPLFKTKEDLQEYWIQWRNTSFQSSCNCE